MSLQRKQMTLRTLLILRLKESVKTTYRVFPAYSLPQNILLRRHCTWVSLSTTKKQSKEVWSRWGVGTGQGDPRYCGLKGAWTENLKIMGTAHISHFTNQETMTEAPSLISSSERAGVEPRTPTTLSQRREPCDNTGMHLPILTITPGGRPYYPCYTRENWKACVARPRSSQRHRAAQRSSINSEEADRFFLLFIALYFMQFRTQVI